MLMKFFLLSWNQGRHNISPLLHNLVAVRLLLVSDFHAFVNEVKMLKPCKGFDWVIIEYNIQLLIHSIIIN